MRLFQLTHLNYLKEAKIKHREKKRYRDKKENIPFLVIKFRKFSYVLVMFLYFVLLPKFSIVALQYICNIAEQ